MADLSIRLWVLVPLVWLTCVPAQAELIFSPANGQTVLDGSLNEFDSIVLVNSLSLRFYGQTVNSFSISDNGNINFTSNTDFFTPPLGTDGIARLSPLWDDYLMLQTPAGTIDNRVSIEQIAGAYVNVTWQNMRLFTESNLGQPFPVTTRSTQLSWFQSDQQVRGFAFQADDIAFSYIPHRLGTSDFGANLYATVGLDSGTGRFAALPGTAAGQVTAQNSVLLPSQPNQFLLFRWNSTLGNYTASIESFTAVPDSRFAIWVVAAAGLAIRLGQRRNPHRATSKPA